MKELKLPAFNEENYFDNQTNSSSRVVLIENCDGETFEKYKRLFTESGYEIKEEYSRANHSFAALSCGDGGVFLNYFESVRELYVITEKNTNYFSYRDGSGCGSCSAQITQLYLEDFGMSYTIRLPDGRFIVIDGGRDFEPDRDNLLRCLKNGSGDGKPIIASWIFTHPHSDHYFCFLGFMESYADQVEIQSFMLNFPEADDLIHYPALAHKNYRFEDSSGTTNIPRMWRLIEMTGAPVYTAHTGKRYKIGEAFCEILASMDDTIHRTQNINAASLVIRMELCGQIILFATDASFSDARLPEKYGEYLKADILQIPHHGFQSGTAQAQIEGYDLIRPRVCLLPVSRFNAYTAFCAHKESTAYLMKQAYVEEIIVGDPEKNIDIPYTPNPYAKAEIDREFKNGQARSGANTWIFTGLNTSCTEDFDFSFLNMTHAEAVVTIELFFTDKADLIRSIKAKTPPLSIKNLSIVGDEVDGDYEYFDWLSLKKKGIPENSEFAVRFTSDIPIVVSHKLHSAVYRSNDV